MTGYNCDTCGKEIDENESHIAEVKKLRLLPGTETTYFCSRRCMMPVVKTKVPPRHQSIGGDGT